MDSTILNLNRLPPKVEEHFDESALNRASKSVVKLDKDLTEAKVKRFVTNTKLRYYLAVWSSLIVACWLWKVGEILVHNKTYQLNDSVLIALLSTTTLNVLGIVAIAMRDIFNGASEQKI